MAFNTTAIDNANNLFDFTTGLNNLLGGGFYILVLFVLFLIVFAVFKRTGVDTIALLFFDGFFITVIAIIMVSLGFIGVHVLFAPIALTVGTLITLIMRE